MGTSDQGRPSLCVQGRIPGGGAAPATHNLPPPNIIKVHQTAAAHILVFKNATAPLPVGRPSPDTKSSPRPHPKSYSRCRSTLKTDFENQDPPPPFSPPPAGGRRHQFVAPRPTFLRLSQRRDKLGRQSGGQSQPTSASHRGPAETGSGSRVRRVSSVRTMTMDHGLTLPVENGC